MDFNNNNENFNDSRESFFQNIETDNLKTSNISGSGISYGNEKNDNTKTFLMIFLILFLIVLIIIMGMKLSNKKSKNNTAEIPVIEGYKDLRVEHEMPKPNELYDASIYKRDKDEIKDFVKNPETEKGMATIPTVPPVMPTIKEVEAIKTVPVKKIASKPVAKPIEKQEKKKTPKKPKIKILKPTAAIAPIKPRLIEKKTEIEGELEMVMVMEEPVKVKSNVKNGTWYVQLVSTLSEVSANSAWVKLKSQHPELFINVKHKVFKSVINGKTYYRLRAIDFDVNSATTFCNNLKAKGLTCFVGK